MAIYYNKTKVSTSSGIRRKESSLGKKILEGAVEEGGIIDLRNSGITRLRPYAFYGFQNSYSSNTAQVLLPDSITELPLYCFAMSSFVTLSPSSYTKIESIGDNCFVSNKLISGGISFPSCISVGKNAFQYANILSANFPLAKTIKSFAFYGCSKMTSASFPLVSVLNSQCFSFCTSLASISLPSVDSMDRYSFQGCTSLVSIALPSLTTAYDYTFSKSSLAKIDISSPCTFYPYAFSEDSALTSLILRSSSTLCTLEDVNAFNSTPVANDTTADTVGYIYVPSNLIDAYKTADNWSTFADHFRAIEDYPDICGE